MRAAVELAADGHAVTLLEAGCRARRPAATRAAVPGRDSIDLLVGRPAPRSRRSRRRGAARGWRRPSRRSGSRARTGSCSQRARSRRERHHSRSAGRMATASRPRAPWTRSRRIRPAVARQADRRRRRGRHGVRLGDRADPARGGGRAHPRHTVRDRIPARRRRLRSAAPVRAARRARRVRATGLASRRPGERAARSRSATCSPVRSPTVDGLDAIVAIEPRAPVRIAGLRRRGPGRNGIVTIGDAYSPRTIDAAIFEAVELAYDVAGIGELRG